MKQQKTAKQKFLLSLTRLNAIIVDAQDITIMLTAIRENEDDFGERYHATDHGYAEIFGELDDVMLQREEELTISNIMFDQMPYEHRIAEGKRKSDIIKRLSNAIKSMEDSYLALAASEFLKYDTIGQLELTLNSSS